MFNSEKYTSLYIEEYTNYIFSNLAENSRFFKEFCIGIKEPLTREFQNYIKIFFKIFSVTMSKQSMIKMRDYASLIERGDPNHKINFYELYLENAKVTVHGYEDCFYLTFKIGDLIINGSFNLLNYLNNQDFDITWESVNLYSEDCYTTIVGNQVFSYTKEKFKESASKGQNLLEVCYPDNIYNLSRNAKHGYFELMRDIYDESIGQNKLVKRKMLY